MSKLKLKNAFVFEDRMTLKLVKNYLTKAMKITVINGVYDDGEMVKDSIAVLERDYERVILEGQKFAMNSELKNVQWVNYYGHAVELFITQLALGIKKSKKDDKDVMNYLNKIQNAIEAVDIWPDYCREIPNAISFNALGEDYHRQIDLMQAFIKKEGLGPFEEITILSETGKLLENQKYLAKVKPM